MGEMQISELYSVIGDFALAHGAKSINELDGCWEQDVGDKGWVSINGHKETRKNSKNQDVPPFHAIIEFNGWPAAIVGPGGGSIMTPGWNSEPGESEAELIDLFRNATPA